MTLKGMVAQNVPFLGVQRASLRQKDNPAKKVDFHFNPTSISFSREVDFTVAPQPNKKVSPDPQWNGSKAIQLTLDILLDGVRDQPFGDVSPEVEQLMAWTNPGGIGAGGAVSALAQAMHGDITGAIGSLTGGGGGGGGKAGQQPPVLMFVWGKLRINGATSFVGHLIHINVDYQMFGRDGTPLRAKVGLKLSSTSEEAAKQNPSSGTEKSDRRHLLRRGQTLQAVAYAVYGDAGAWRAIADANGIDDPFRVKAGAELLLPELSATGR